MTRVRLLVGAVIGMGVLIAVGLVVLVAGIVYKAGGTAGGTESPGPADIGKLRTDAVSLGLPAAAKVLQITQVRGALAVLVRLPSGEQVIYAVPMDRRQAPFRIQVTGPQGRK